MPLGSKRNFVKIWRQPDDPKQPSVNDDDVGTRLGIRFEVGDLWLDVSTNPHSLYECLENSTGAAVWKKLVYSDDILGVPKAKAFADSGYNALINDSIYVDASGGITSIVLPAATSSNIGMHIKIKKIDASGNSVDITVSGGGTVEGGLTNSLNSQFDHGFYESDGSQWWRF